MNAWNFWVLKVFLLLKVGISKHSFEFVVPNDEERKQTEIPINAMVIDTTSGSTLVWMSRETEVDTWDDTCHVTVFWCYSARSSHCEDGVHWRHFNKSVIEDNQDFIFPDQKHVDYAFISFTRNNIPSGMIRLCQTQSTGKLLLSCSIPNKESFLFRPS